MSVRPNPIRVVKRKQRELLQLQEVSALSLKSENELQREMVREVSSWINERRETELEAWQKAAVMLTPAACEIEAN